MSAGRATPPAVVVAMTISEKAALQELADAEGVTPEIMAERLGVEALQRRLQGQRKYPPDVRRLPR